MSGKHITLVFAALFVLGLGACGIFSSSSGGSAPALTTSACSSSVTLASSWNGSTSTWTASPSITTTAAYGTGTSDAANISGTTTAVASATGVMPTYSWTGNVHSVVVQTPGTISGANTYYEIFELQVNTFGSALTSPYVHGKVPTGSSAIVDQMPTLTAGNYRILVLGTDNVHWGCLNFQVP